MTSADTRPDDTAVVEDVVVDDGRTDDGGTTSWGVPVCDMARVTGTLRRWCIEAN